MIKSIGLHLLVVGGLLCALGTLVHGLLPAETALSFYACLGGGGLCLLWGTAALLGKRFRALALATLVPLCFVLLSQVVMVAWPTSGSGGVGRGRAFALLCLSLALSLGALIRIASSNVVRYGNPPNPAPQPHAGPGRH